MRCGKLTLPQIAMLGAYVLILGGIDELGLNDKPILILAISLAVAVTLALSGRNCGPLAGSR